MHIVHIYKDYPPVIGGIEHHVRDLAEGLVARGHQNTVLVTSLDRRTSIERVDQLTIVRAARAIHAASTPLSLAMLRHAAGLHADIVHLQFPFPPGDLAAMLVGGAPRLVISYQSDIVRQQQLLRFYSPLLRTTLRRASRILASSPAYITSSPWLAEHAAKCRVVPLGIDTVRLKEPDAQQIADQRRALLHDQTGSLALFVGRLRYYKGLHLAIEALRSVPDVVLVLAGTGTEEARLRNQAQVSGVAERVVFLGDVADDALPALYYACDFFVLPSHLRAEAYGIAQLEALACGLPSISTELATGTSWVNLHEVTGLVVPPGDVAALAVAMRQLADNPGLRSTFGLRAKQRVAEFFTLERMLDGVEAVYREAMKQ
jgi:glycosyltransferase involved in cell wall biosynthesis